VALFRIICANCFFYSVHGLMICRTPTATESLVIDTIKTPASQFTVLLLSIVLILPFFAWLRNVTSFGHQRNSFSVSLILVTSRTRNHEEKAFFSLKAFYSKFAFIFQSLILTILVYCRLIFSPVTSPDADIIWRGVSDMFHSK